MPVEAPQLDDLHFDRVVEELVRLIPVYAPEWTNHNDSDPGIAMIQLFAHLAEQVGYRLNRIPEKNHIELLKLLGVRLESARAARTYLAFLLNDPSTLSGFSLAAGAVAKARSGDPPPEYETDKRFDIVPAQVVALVTTKHGDLRDLRRRDDGTYDPAEDVPEDARPNETEWLSVAWDGETPPLAELPMEPASLTPRLPNQQHPYLWIGLDYNVSRSAGFRGVEVTLTLQLDDDEKPDLSASAQCAPAEPVVGYGAPRVDWLSYYDAEKAAFRIVPGRIVDDTARFTQSGSLRFVVPFDVGAIPEDAFVDLRPAGSVTPLGSCKAEAAELRELIITSDDLIDTSTLISALTDAIEAPEPVSESAVPHPLDPALRQPDRVRTWLRIQLAEPLAGGGDVTRARMLTFNAAPATNARTVTNELLGVSDGRPGQELRTARGNVLAGSLELAVRESGDTGAPMITWIEVDSLDTAGPFDRVYSLDAEAGTVRFGDGHHGRIPPLVPGGGQVIALRYRHGGGVAGEVGPGAITVLESQSIGVAGVTNPVAATGGADAETLADAKIRARKQLATRGRAVTSEDFEFLALRTPNVRVARAHVVPLRAPLNLDTGPEIGASGGLDDAVAPGAVSVVVVPDETGPEPIPTPSFLHAVCVHLDRHRLVTTEVHVIPPQYCRIGDLFVAARGKAGYSRAQLQTLVGAALAEYLHVLRGGDDGAGFPFGGQLHIADLIARVFRTEGIERVEDLRCDFSRTKANAAPRMGVLVRCPSAAGETDSVQLGAEETASLDLSTFTLNLVR